MILKDGTHFQIDLHSLTILRKAYPQIDIEAELNKIDAWCMMNPAKRKTQRGALRFINAWMSRCRPEVSRTTSTRHRSLQDDLTDTSWAN